jgi:hypothetical protein
MTTDDLDNIGGAPGRICAACGHHEDDHQLQDFELSGNTARRVFCSSCEEFHDFLARAFDD